MKLLALIAAVLLVGCEVSSRTPPELTRTMTLRVHWADADMIARLAQERGDPVAERDGYTILVGAPGAFECDVYVIKPPGTGTAVQTLLGHELLHCIYGAYHL